MSASAADRERLLKLLGMLGSSYAGERDAAGLAAMRFLRERNLSWTDIIATPTAVADRSSAIAICIRNLGRLTKRERAFVVSLRRFRRISPKQRDWLHDIAARLQEAGCAA